METNIKGFSLFWELYNSDTNFRMIIDEGLASNQIRFFNETELEKMQNQNYIAPIPKINGLDEMFITGLNIGDCKNMSYQLSYSYNDVDIVTGILPTIKGSRGAEKEGGHVWL